MAEHKMVVCPACTAVLDLGDEQRGEVVACLRNRWQPEDVKRWGSARTRVEVAHDDDPVDQQTREAKPQHIVQLDPPETEDERRTREDAARANRPMTDAESEVARASGGPFSDP